MEYCENCGSKAPHGLCVHCDEEFYIQEQVRQNEMEEYEAILTIEEPIKSR